MVEIDSDGSLVLDSPESIEKKEKQANAKELDDKINHMRHRKEVDYNIKQRRELALLKKKNDQIDNNKKHVVEFSDPDGAGTWKAEILNGATKVKTFPNNEYPEHMAG